MAKEEKKEEKKDDKKNEGKKGPLARAVTLTVYALAAIAGIWAFATGLFWGPLTWLERAGYDKGEKLSAVKAGEKVAPVITEPAISFLHLGDRVDTRPPAPPPPEDILAELSKPLDSGPLNAAQKARAEKRAAQAAAKARAAGKKPAAKK